MRLDVRVREGVGEKVYVASSSRFGKRSVRLR